MSRDCPYYEQLMSRMADGCLSAADARALETHLLSCPECARLYGAYAAETLLREDTAEPPEALARGVMAQIRAGEAAPAPVRKRHTRRWTALAAAACLALIIAGTALVSLRGRLSSGTDMAEAVYEAAAQDAAPAEAPAGGYDGGADGSLSVTEAESAAEEPAAEEAETAAPPESVEGAYDEAGPERAYKADAAADAAIAPSRVPEGREADFEALIASGGSAPETETDAFHVLASVEYSGVIYEFLTDGSEETLLWREAGGDSLTLSPGAPAALRDILGEDYGENIEVCYDDPNSPLAEQTYEVGPPNYE